MFTDTNQSSHEHVQLRKPPNTQMCWNVKIRLECDEMSLISRKDKSPVTLERLVLHTNRVSTAVNQIC